MNPRNNNKTIWSIGATSKIAIELQRIWAKKGFKFILCSRDKKDLLNIKDDLLIRGATNVHIYSMEELSTSKPIQPMDILLISIGSLSEQPKWQTSKEYRDSQWHTNTTLVMDWVEWGAAEIESSGRGQICVMTSVAADRAKKSNYGYGTAKAALDYYLEGVSHRLAKLGNRITILKPGPTKSPMTSKLSNKKLADPKDVAFTFSKAIEKNKAVAYAPSIWKYIMLIIKYIPRKIWFKTDL